MLELRPNCEACDRDLAPGAPDALICSFECTFCRPCAEGALGGRCPNCGGELVARPRRPESELAQYPASTTRVLGAACALSDGGLGAQSRRDVSPQGPRDGIHSRRVPPDGPTA